MFEEAYLEADGIRYKPTTNSATIEVKGVYSPNIVLHKKVVIEGKGYTVSLTEGAFSNNKDIKTVTIGNDITDIPSRLFSGCSGIKTLTIGSGVRSIAKEAFVGCNYIEKIFTKAVVPPTCADKSVFDDYVYLSAVVTVPNERNSIDRYKAANVWKDFFEIVENIPTGINEQCSIFNSAERNYYNLQGQRSVAPARGLNVVNGNKVLR